MTRHATLLVALGLVAGCATPARQPAQAPAGGESNARATTLAGRSTVYAPRAGIATSHPLASAAALEVLQRGGNAVDAAVTAAAVLTVVEPHMTGIGGDMFALVWLAGERRLIGINASGRSGSLMTREELGRRGHTSVPLFGVESVTVPGTLSGWAMLLERFGSIPLARALEPAIRLADEGFPVSQIIADQWEAEAERLRGDEGARSTFLVDGMRAPHAGEWFRNPDFARTLRTVASEGPGAMYGGTLGRRIADHMREHGGFLTIEDLRHHRAREVTPISASFRGHRVWQLPPNNQGIAVLEMLRILEPFDLRAMGHNSVGYLHHLVEAKKLAFADLNRYVGDPEHMPVPVDRLLTDEFIAERRARLDPHRAAERQEPGGAITQSETIYLSAADGEGNMISLINSNYWEFGSGVVVPGTGFVLQNRGAGFTLEPGRANTVAPRKLPFHTLIPGFVTRTVGGAEEPWLSYGVMGGAMQPQGHVQLLLNLIVFEMELQTAIDAPRFRHTSGVRVAIEEPVPDAVRDGLRAMGHDVREGSTQPWGFGGAQVVMRLPRGWALGSDPRKDGQAVGW
ncbi:MAG TPA: gamma-glutamyltransferase [Gemmatimonadaceae bacterium]|nr:gamma-glutamyltransferase [Gemmatimonadaceae bacterium]